MGIIQEVFSLFISQLSGFFFLITAISLAGVSKRFLWFHSNSLSISSSNSFRDLFFQRLFMRLLLSVASWKISSLAVNGQSFLVIDGYLLDSILAPAHGWFGQVNKEIPSSERSFYICPC